MEWLLVEPWHWLVLGVLLLVAEVLGAGGFLIGLALAAFLQSVIVVTADNLSWDFQLLIYAINSIVFTWVYWRFFRKFNQQTDTPLLNDRAAQFVGRSFELKEALVHGEGRVQIGDSLWKVRSQQELAAGATVKVVASEGMTLLIEPA